MTYIDAILHIADYPALATAIAARSPGAVSEDGQIVGFASTPAVRSGVAALVYVRITDDQAKQWRGTPGVTVLAEAPYGGPDTSAAVYAALTANAKAMALYDAVYPRSPMLWTDEDGKPQSSQPPLMFGVMG